MGAEIPATTRGDDDGIGVGAEENVLLDDGAAGIARLRCESGVYGASAGADARATLAARTMRSTRKPALERAKGLSPRASPTTLG